MAPKYQFYAVRSGRSPSSRGVYTSWAECKKETTGVKRAQHGHKAVFKGFQSKKEAHTYLSFADDDEAALWVHNKSITAEPNTPEGDKRRRKTSEDRLAQREVQSAPDNQSSSSAAPNHPPQRQLRPRGTRPNYAPTKGTQQVPLRAATDTATGAAIADLQHDVRRLREEQERSDQQQAESQQPPGSPPPLIEESLIVTPPGVYTFDRIADKYTLNLSETERLGPGTRGGPETNWGTEPNPRPPQPGWPLHLLPPVLQRLQHQTAPQPTTSIAPTPQPTEPAPQLPTPNQRTQHPTDPKASRTGCSRCVDWNAPPSRGPIGPYDDLYTSDGFAAVREEILETVVLETVQRLSDDDTNLIETLRKQAVAQSRGSQLNFMRVALKDNHASTLKSQFQLEQQRQEDIVWAKVQEIETIYRRKIVRLQVVASKQKDQSQALVQRIAELQQAQKSYISQIATLLQPQAKTQPSGSESAHLPPPSPTPSTPPTQDGQGAQWGEDFDSDTQFDEDGHYIHDPDAIAERRRDWCHSHGQNLPLPSHIAHYNPKDEYDNDSDGESQLTTLLIAEDQRLEREKDEHLRQLIEERRGDGNNGIRQRRKKGDSNTTPTASQPQAPASVSSPPAASSSSFSAPQHSTKSSQRRGGSAASKAPDTPRQSSGEQHPQELGFRRPKDRNTRRVSFQQQVNKHGGDRGRKTNGKHGTDPRHTGGKSPSSSSSALPPPPSPDSNRKRKAAKGTTNTRPQAKDFFFVDPPPSHSPQPNRKRNDTRADNTDDDEEWRSGHSSPEFVVDSSSSEDDDDALQVQAPTPRANWDKLFQLLEDKEPKDKALRDFFHDQWNADIVQGQQDAWTKATKKAAATHKPKTRKGGRKDKDGAGAGSGTRN